MRPGGCSVFQYFLCIEGAMYKRVFEVENEYQAAMFCK